MIRAALAELWRRDRALAVVGWLHVALFAGLLVVAPFDSREILGINPWIKPLKFAFSVAIYVWTLAWFLGEMEGPRWGKRAVSWGVSLAMLVEIVCVVLQSARGTTSHFNFATAFDGQVFSLMGNMIALNTVLLLLFFLLTFLRLRHLPPAYAWGIRLGTLGLLLGSAEGAVMIANGAHSVGLADGGPGLPLVNWSTVGGDLRLAHLIGLHAFQLLPLAGWWIARRGRRLVTLFVVATVYFALGAALFLQALRGRPLIGA